MDSSCRAAAAAFVDFLNAAVTPYHAVAECVKMLRSAGFAELRESETWNIKPMNKYYLTRNNTCVYAFAVGGRWQAGNGNSIVAAHTDSPCLRIKPNAKLEVAGCKLVGVSTYGGGLWRTWFDRDLSVAGQVVIREEGVLRRRLVDVKKPVLFIPNLAIHLETDREKFVCNKEDHLRPILASFAVEQLTKPAPDNQVQESKSVTSSMSDKCQHSMLTKLIADSLQLAPERIIDWDLYLYDTQPAAVVGCQEEFISGGRLDNLVGTFAAVRALIDSLEDNKSLEQEENVRLAVCFDNEECGSKSAQGAETGLTQWILRRLSAGGENDAFERSVAKSFIVSADQAHACHPNYKGKHEENHQPQFHKGVVVKVNNNLRYATTSLTHAIFKEIAAEADVPLQVFCVCSFSVDCIRYGADLKFLTVVVRNDAPCGTTIGPMLSANLAIPTIDVGTAQLAMHSIREFADVSGIRQATKLYSAFYKRYATMWAAMEEKL